MAISLHNYWGRKWEHLSRRSGAKRLSRFALVLLFALDIFILVAISDGQRNVALVVEVPRPPFFNSCQEMSYNFIHLNARDRVDRMSRIFLSAPSAKEKIKTEFSDDTRALKTCEGVRTLLLLIVSDKGLISLFGEREKQSHEIDFIRSKISDLKSSYEAALLEKVAEQSREDSILPASAKEIKGNIALLNNDLSVLQSEQAATQAALEGNAMLLSYATKVSDLLASGELEQARRRLEHDKFLYPFKVMGVQIGFLLPLLMLAIFWNARAIKRQDDSQILISSHFVLVCLLPIFLRILEFIYELLPGYLAATILARLIEINLGFLVNYGIILGGIGGGLLVIFIAQKTFFKPARQRIIRLRKIQCCNCGEKLSSNVQAWCEACGTGQFETCHNCGRNHRILAFYCHHCGSKQS